MTRPTITTYCDRDDVQARLSAEGVRLRADDDLTALDDAIASAAVEVNGYLQPRYDPAELAQSNWVRYKARDVCVVLLCERRNNPVPKAAQRRYEEAVKDLKAVAAGWMIVPDAAERRVSVPALSNLRVASYPVPHPVVVAGTSTGPTPTGYVRHADTLGDVIDYSI